MNEVVNSKQFGQSISGLIEGKDFSRAEMEGLFTQVLLDQQSEMQQGAFLAALKAKGETVEEIAGSWDAIYNLDTIKLTPQLEQPLVENCGTGMDKLNTFNISTAASIVAAAGGVNMARHGSRAITSNCGTIDILEELGVGVECAPELIVKSIEEVGIGVLNGMDSKIHPTALGRILARISFGTTLNIAASLANPVYPKYGVRGVYSRELLKPVAKVMHKIGYKKAIVVHGLAEDGISGMDEASTLGRNHLVEIDETGQLKEYSIDPRSLGIEKASSKDILPCQDRQSEALELIKVLKGGGEKARSDIIALNTALIFYLMDYHDQLKTAYEAAKEIINSGKAINKLKKWVQVQNSEPEKGLKKLDRLLAKI
ncbi:anthranilate phosphoribosyltransferase [Halanaerobium hydrogeniformans]|uniref:Anthranilate phosphoribosyltransferase n=1 Tax=Halanaerobium hydrogeniformans TaxID=656519 RepID=E4RNR9_HALHG|nr:anthranilate phosphoribosyltransferase [Halanaerobium hydrogeniformans]ADQ13747.1 anthranilate phosphoribosyltransferase [Halanaerobium hydrogeniformans]